MSVRRTLAAHLRLGARGEDAAVEYLRAKGYAVLDRNWRAGRLEIDAVAEQDGTLVFVEVKTRGTGSLGTPADGLSKAKCAKLAKAAALYLTERDWWSRPCRFDLLTVAWGEGGMVVEHITDVLDFAEAGGGAWQPW